MDHDRGSSSFRPRAGQTGSRAPRSPTACRSCWVSGPHPVPPSQPSSRRRLRPHLPARPPRSAPPPQPRTGREGPHSPLRLHSICRSTRERRTSSWGPGAPPRAPRPRPLIGCLAVATDGLSPTPRPAEDGAAAAALALRSAAQAPPAKPRGRWGGSGSPGEGGAARASPRPREEALGSPSTDAASSLAGGPPRALRAGARAQLSPLNIVILIYLLL